MSQDYRKLTTFVQQVRHALYQRRLLQGGTVLLTVLLAILLLGLGVQYLVPLFPLAALLYSALALVVILALVGYVVRPAVRLVSQRQALSRIEDTYPDLHDDLTNALQLDIDRLERDNPHGVALELVRALHHRTAQQVAQYTDQEVVQQRRFFGLAWCGMLVVTAVAVSLLQPGALGQALHMLLQPLSYLPSNEMQIAITPEHSTIAQGTNLEVQARVQGRAPRTMQIHVKRQGEASKAYSMEPLDTGGFRYTFLKPPSSLTFYAAASSFVSPTGTLTVVPSPAIGQMALRYLFPEYTNLPERLQEGGGDIQALPGTRVQLRLRANVPLHKGFLRFDTGRELPLTITGQELQGEMLVMQPGAYSVEIEDTHSLKNPRPPRYTVQVQPDLTPTVTIIEPQEGLEVDETTALQVHYKAEDDFGLQNAALVYFGAGSVEKRIPLHSGRFEHRQVQETFIWDMHQWLLPESDTVQMYVEVYDNDTISGPKKGVSETLTLKVRNRGREHEAFEKLQEHIAEEVLDVLADHLDLSAQLEEWRERAAMGESPTPEALDKAQEQQRQSMERVDEVAQQIEQALARVQNDPYSTYETFADLQAMQRNMSHLQSALMTPLQQSMQALTPQEASPEQLARPAQQLEDVLRELERLATLSENVASGEKMQDLLRLGTKMMEQQNALLAALDNLPKNFQGGQVPPDLQRMMDQLNALMQELMNAVAQLPTTLSDEFLNRQLNSLPLADMQRQLQQLQEKLMAGDLEGARQLAADLLKTLSTMVASMQNMQQQARGGAMDALGQQLQQSSDRLADLVQRQEQILNETQQIDQDTVEALNDAQKRAFESVQQQLAQELNKLSRSAWDLLRQARQHPHLDPTFEDLYKQLMTQLQNAQRSLKEPDVPQVITELQEAAQNLERMQHSARRGAQGDPALSRQIARLGQNLQAAQQMLDNLPQDRQAMLNPAQKGQLQGLGEQQGGVQEETRALQQEFEQLFPIMPFLPSEMGQQLKEAVPFMGQAQAELGVQRSQPAIPPEQAALERLRNAQNAFQQAMQAMAQRNQMMGMSLPMLRQAGRFPMNPQMDVNEQQGGVGGANVRNFQLPDKEAYKVPRMFREDIMEALQEGYPERYKELIEHYYRDIVR
jgi:hypothetical protein